MIKWTEQAEIKLPDDVQATMENNELKIKGKLGEASRIFRDNYVKAYIEGSSVKIATSKNNKYTKGIVGTWYSETKLLIEGVTKGFEYHMKIDFTHFPMRVSVRGDKLIVENFLGEKSPRSAKIVDGCKVSVKGDRITINGIDKRKIGETAANIERATYIRHFDARVFQDGIFLLKGEVNE
ncbi:50S ribosomal protein L6 [Picrophilus oshimae]|uniref:Large ribosomal subunit protein uL6 n=2 Tax=Picrophilus torridus (strain ATCC 700027 / DSM 9790 / JCM 10055 / NBRC 100828 / KAW 2/3) TaxID=1122961 RepID=RL6_PICTO|nr:50S ribosomal protein L6 [Picrophilus oshimae]Q6L1B1.1 RecName: Full=Large ribosomal subunit protein uL6; AltName: Full=50S ribosomal protein L6 [Picrophilus oshimae DSM 9789]AAT43241.1 large subunit ribosomal protein L6P [Picrophilus oshimae DSM 9789]SMD30453.1 LSU ribosomal protein L6P [Picrophilus oshimae DSM 9789]